MKRFLKMLLSIKNQLLVKTRPSSNKSRKYQTYSPSPTPIVHQRVASPTKTSPLTNNKFRSKSPNRHRRCISNQQELVRSSSCGDIPSTNFMQKQYTRSIIDQLSKYLTRIRALAQQIRLRDRNNTNGKDTI